MGEKAVAGKRPVGRGQRPGERVKRPFPTPRLRGAPRVVSGCPNQVIGTGREVLSTCLIWAVQRRLRSHAARPSRAALRCVSADAPHDHEAPLCASRGSPLCLLPETFLPPHMPLSTNAASPQAFLQEPALVHSTRRISPSSPLTETAERFGPGTELRWVGDGRGPRPAGGVVGGRDKNMS